MQSNFHTTPPTIYGETLNLSLTPILASSTSRYFNTPGTATVATSSPPLNRIPCPSDQVSLLLSCPSANFAHLLQRIVKFLPPASFLREYSLTVGAVERKLPQARQMAALV